MRAIKLIHVLAGLSFAGSLYFTVAISVIGCTGQDNTPNAAHASSAELERAAENGDTSKVTALITVGIDPNGDPNGPTPLMAASQNGHVETAELLLSKGADINRANTSGWTALIFAAYNGQKNVISLLLDHGAQIDGRLSDGRTAIMMAVLARHTEAVKLLLDRGCNLNLQDKNGSSAPMFAAAVGDTAVARMLVAKGCDLSLQDKNGHTALDWARQKNDSALIDAFTGTAATDAPVDWNALANMLRSATNSRQAILDCIDILGRAPTEKAALNAQQKIDSVVDSLEQLSDAGRRMGIPVRNGVLFNGAGVSIMNGQVDLKHGGSGLLVQEHLQTPNADQLANRSRAFVKLQKGMYWSDVVNALGVSDNSFEQADGNGGYQKIAFYSLPDAKNAIIWIDGSGEITLIYVANVAERKKL